MPRSTVKYGFEFAILDWAHRFSTVMTGQDRGFFMVLTLDGAVQQVLFGGAPHHFDLAVKDSLIESNQCWLFYDPFDAPEYMWIEWRNVQRSTLERLMDKCFEAADFTQYNGR